MHRYLIPHKKALGFNQVPKSWSIFESIITTMSIRKTMIPTSFSLEDDSSNGHSSIVIILSKDTYVVDPPFNFYGEEYDDSFNVFELIFSCFNIMPTSLDFSIIFFFLDFS